MTVKSEIERASAILCSAHEELFRIVTVMAAAPDLLAALRKAREYVQETFNGFGDPREKDLLDEIDAAIKKAEGRS